MRHIPEVAESRQKLSMVSKKIECLLDLHSLIFYMQLFFHALYGKQTNDLHCFHSFYYAILKDGGQTNYLHIYKYCIDLKEIICLVNNFFGAFNFNNGFFFKMS